MRVFIISSPQNLDFARKILEGTDAKVLTSFGINSLTPTTKRDIQLSDAVIVLIDDELSTNPKNLAELECALSAASNPNRVKNPIIIPILIADAQLPSELSNALYIKCNSQALPDINKTRKTLLQFFQMNKLPIESHSSSTFRLFFKIIFPMVFTSITVFLMVLAINSSEYASILDKLDPRFSFSDLLLGSSAAVAVLTVLLSLFLLYIVRTNRNSTDSNLEAYSQRLKDTIISESHNVSIDETVREDDAPEIDALGRMLINLEDIKEYYTWSQKQAKSSFYFAVRICIFGFLLLAVAVVIPFFSDSNLEASVISAIGGVISELIACTALIVYKNSLSQLNHYHQALHEDERFLSSVNLLNRFSTIEAQDEMLKELIRSEIQMNLNAAQTATPGNAKEK